MISYSVNLLLSCYWANFLYWEDWNGSDYLGSSYEFSACIKKLGKTAFWLGSQPVGPRLQVGLSPLGLAAWQHTGLSCCYPDFLASFPTTVGKGKHQGFSRSFWKACWKPSFCYRSAEGQSKLEMSSHTSMNTFTELFPLLPSRTEILFPDQPQ